MLSRREIRRQQRCILGVATVVHHCKAQARVRPATAHHADTDPTHIVVPSTGMVVVCKADIGGMVPGSDTVSGAVESQPTTVAVVDRAALACPCVATASRTSSRVVRGTVQLWVVVVAATAACMVALQLPTSVSAAYVYRPPAGIPPLPIPDPPDVDKRQQQLLSYRNGSCAQPVEKVQDAKLVFGVIAKGEAPYMEEWVLYHLFIGVDLIYLYDNEDELTYHRMFACNPRVMVIPFPHQPGHRGGIQIMAQEHLMSNFNYKHTWAMLPNADEFIVLKHHYDIKHFAAQYISESSPGIALQWLTFGHSRQLFSRDQPLSVRFTHRASHLFKTIKTLFGCAWVERHWSPHYPIYNTTAFPATLVYGADPSRGRPLRRGVPSGISRPPRGCSLIALTPCATAPICVHVVAWKRQSWRMI